MPTAGDPGVLRRLKSVETKVDRLATDLNSLATDLNRMATDLAAVEVRLGAKIDVQLDDIRDVIRKFAEGLGGRLDTIARQLIESNKNWEAKFSDHDLAIRDHTRRISSLEQSRS